jgi:rsbT antagonist protein RsbS
VSESVSIPIIKLYDTLIVSIQVDLSDRVVMKLKDDIAETIERTGCRGLIIDVSGVYIMDSYISRVIRDIGIISKLMGVQTVICGLDPNISMTLVEMGMGFEGVRTLANLESAFEAVHQWDDARDEDEVLDSDEADDGPDAFEPGLEAQDRELA